MGRHEEEGPLPGFAPGEHERIEYLFAAWRARQALNEAPEVLAHVRSLVMGSDGRVEPGEILRIDSTPLRVTPTDAADELYAQLVNWVIYWAEVLEEQPPAAAVAWANMREVQGFRAGTTEEGALLLTRVQTMWLLLRHERIVEEPYGPQYVQDITSAIWRVKARFPTREPRPRAVPVMPRPCPICQGNTVEVYWFSEKDQAAPAVLCSLCGWMPKSERDVARVLMAVAA